MFVLNPGGGEGGAPSQLSQNLWFFGQLSVYFVAIRGAYLFFSGREDPKSLDN
jgi:hypothetical protein